MTKYTLPIINPHNQLTQTHPNQDAAYDLHLTEDVTIGYRETLLAPTGLHMALPDDIAGLIQLRSSTPLKWPGLSIPNSPGLVDPGYTGEIKIQLTSAYQTHTIPAGTRIAQLRFCPIARPIFLRIPYLDDSTRGQGGFGSTGETATP